MIYAEEGKMILRLNNEKDNKSTALGCNFAWTVKGVSDFNFTFNVNDSSYTFFMEK